MSSTLRVFQEHGKTLSLEDRDINPLVCLSNKCQRIKCCLSCKKIPSDCPYGILHLFVSVENGDKPRRWGKTKYLTGLAKDLSEAGYKIYYVTRTHSMSEGIRDMYMLGSNDLVEFLTINVIKMGGGLCSKKDGYLLCDEITDDDVRWLENYTRDTGFKILAHLWTSI